MDRRAVRSLNVSPLPQEERGVHAAPVRIQDAFTQFLPARDLLFFQRVYFAPYPRPFQVAGPPNFPVALPLAEIEAPANQVIVIQHVSFRVFMHSGIGVNDIIQVPPSRVTTYFGFQFQIGNRGLTDYSSNINARGQPVNLGGNAGTSLPPQPGQSSYYPFAGASFPLNNFASYARPRSLISAKILVLQRPEYDTRLFSVEMGGYLLGEGSFDHVMEKLGQR